MSKIIVKNTKTGLERPMTQKSFDYLSSKKRGFEFVRKIVEPGSIEDHKARLIAEKAEKEAAAKNQAGEQSQESEQQAEVKQPAKRGPKPKTV